MTHNLITYDPSKDIKGDYSADVRYGMLAGLNPAQGLIFIQILIKGTLLLISQVLKIIMKFLLL